MRFKAGVSVTGLRPELVLALVLAEQVYADQKAALVVTSVMDGTHTRNSLHYLGLAADLRTRHLDADTLGRVVRQLEDTLAPLGFQVILEEDHVHLEHDPTGRSVLRPQVA